jgi:hypothetical protein
VQAPGQSQNLVDDWREDLQPSIKAAKVFLETYGEYMEGDDRKDVFEAMTSGEEALRQGNQSVGQKATLLLRSKILGSGTASLLFIAERSMHGLPAEQSQLMAQAVASLRTAHKRGHQSEVDRLSGELRMVVAQLMTQRMSVRGVEDRRSWEDLLRVGQA